MGIVERNLPGRGEPAERRQLTILFCDLVDSADLSSGMDPEDLHELMVSFQQYCVQRIEEAGGYVARFAGDGILAYFGYPVALEDAPQRAVYAGLTLREAGDHLARPDGKRLSVRVGVATGLVVVGDLVSSGATERAVSGETPNLAARLQALASADRVLVSDTTKHLTEGLFAFRSLGPVKLKGLPTALVWEVEGARATLDRYEGRRAIGLCPMISRSDELEILLEAWRESRDGRRRVAGIVGDPGIGKSRLLEEVRRHIRRDETVLWLEGGGASFYDNTPFYVASQIGHSLADLIEAQDPRAQLLEELPDRSGHGTRSQPGRSDHRDELMALLTELIERAAARQPVVLVVEDLHWVDPSTLELLDQVVRAQAEGSILLLYTSRVEIADRWPVDGVRHRTVTLTRLSDVDSAALARSVGGGRLRLAQIETVVAQTAGVPLFVEELARLLADQAAASPEFHVPPSLSDLLATRLERAGPAKRHAQLASVLGREFSASLFAAMVEPEGVAPQAALEDLVSRSIIVRRPGGVCAFRHALIAVAAYDTLLKRERRELHERAARIILERHPTLAQEHPEVVARHWTLAGRFQDALDAWEAAGKLANQRRAFREAEHAYRQLLGVLDRAERADRDHVELRVRIAFNRILQITQGYASAEAHASADIVTELARRIGDPNAVAREEQVKWRSFFTAGDYAQARSTVDRVMLLMDGSGERWPRLFALRCGIQEGFYSGDLARAERDFLSWQAARDGRHRGAGDDVLSMGIGGLIAQVTGRRSVALERMRAAFEIASDRGNPYDLAMANHCDAALHNLALDPERQALAAARIADVAAQSGFEYAGHLATIWEAITDLNAGRAASAVQRASAAIKAFDRQGARVSMSLWLSVLARAQALAGDIDEALATFELALSDHHQEVVLRPAVLLARAGVLQDVGRTEAACADLDAVVRIAGEIGARLYEFRALNELAAMRMKALDRAGVKPLFARAQALAHLEHCPADRALFEAVRSAAADPL